jgi:hypothetical protein
VALLLGDIRLYTLSLHAIGVSGDGSQRSIQPQAALASANMRLVLEQMLVMKAIAEADGGSMWVVNARQ